MIYDTQTIKDMIALVRQRAVCLDCAFHEAEDPIHQDGICRYPFKHKKAEILKRTGAFNTCEYFLSNKVANLFKCAKEQLERQKYKAQMIELPEEIVDDIKMTIGCIIHCYGPVDVEDACDYFSKTMRYPKHLIYNVVRAVVTCMYRGFRFPSSAT